MSLSETGIQDFPPTDLRRRAESLLNEDDSLGSEALPPAQLIRELKLQRIELELQNEELRRSEQRLEASRERYVDLYFHAPVGYLTLDPQAEIEELNFLAAELLGQSRKCLLQTSLFDQIEPASRPALQSHLNELFQGTGVHHCQLALTLSSGSRVHLKMLSIAIESSDSTTLQCRSALFDITEQYKATENVADLQEQLRQAHRLEALGRLTSGIAHDFNNLLTLIIGYSKLALNQLPENSPFARHALQINKAGHHASELIEQLLTFSRTQTVSARSVDVNELVTDMEKMFDRLVGDDIELHLSLDPELGAPLVDASQLQQVLMNLVVNAREAMPQGGELYIRTRNVSVGQELASRRDISAGAYILIEVEDTGLGIHPEVLPHIFEPHFSTKNTSKAHGFGLSTTNSIIRQHHGVIDVDSHPKRGTTFSVYLPHRDASDSLSTASTTPCILVVDDQPDLRDFASIVLNQIDVEVLKARSADDALQQARTHGSTIALVVTDVVMPGVSGPELIERIHHWHPDAQALYISGHDRETLCEERGIDPEAPFLEKPFSPERLLEMVESLLVRHRN